MEARNFSLSVTLPAYNEEGVIRETVSAVIEYCSMKSFVFEVMVVNDGSRDRTRQIVEELRKTNPEVKLVNHPQNKGYGEALRTGFNAAGMEWLFLMDSDGQFDIRGLDEFLSYAEANDMVLGYRVKRADAWHRVLYGRGYTLLMNILFGMRFRDIDCAFKLFRKSAWDAVQPITSTDHKIFTVEWLWKSKYAGLRITERPTHHLPRTKGAETGARPDVVWQMVKALLRLYLRLWAQPR